MVGNNSDRYVVILVISIVLTRDSTNGIKYLSDGINLKEIVNALKDTRESLKTHACIYVLLNKLGVVAVAVVVEL